jgi:hypothetical protein
MQGLGDHQAYRYPAAWYRKYCNTGLIPVGGQAAGQQASCLQPVVELMWYAGWLLAMRLVFRLQLCAYLLIEVMFAIVFASGAHSC